ncbi:hypothetical protein ACFX2C_000527 [Malus domestica]
MIKLTNSNWVTWKPRMKDILYCKDLHEPIEGDAAKPESMSDAEWKKMNRKVIGTIRQWVDDSVFHHVSNETNAREFWTKLESLFEKKTSTKKAFLIKELINVKYKDGLSVAEHLNNFQNIINQLATMKMTIEDELQTLLFLGSLPEVGKPLCSQVFVTENRGRSKSRGPRGHGKSPSRSKSRFREILSVGECLHMGNSDKDIEWIFDNGASFHATSKQEFFSTYKEGDFGIVKMGNESYSKILGIGDICRRTNLGCQLMLKDVRHIPDIRLNLISIGTLDRQGYYHHIGKEKLKLTKGLMVVARARLCCTLYRSNTKVLKGELNAVDDSSLDLWHKRLGYMSKKGLQVLAKKSHIPFAKDVCGLMEVESLGRNKYFVTYIDDASRKVWVFLLKSKDQYGDGISFFLAPFDSKIPKNSTGGYLALFSSDSSFNSTKNQIVDVEFDSFQNSWDPSPNHVGINVNSIVSIANVSWKTTMKIGSVRNAWVSYNSTSHNLSVFLTYSKNPKFSTGDSSVSYIVDLSKVLLELVSVGFSAATGAWVEVHNILSWSFSSTLEISSNNEAERKIRIGVSLGAGFGLLSCGLGLFSFISWRKRAKKINEAYDMSMNDEFDKGTGPRRFTYRELSHAINNFFEGGKLREGGFGGVYMGLLTESNT